MKSKITIFLSMCLLLTLYSCKNDNNSVKTPQKLISNSLVMPVNGSKAIEVTPNSSGITWSSEDMNIAVVNSLGVVTGISEGTTKITLNDEATGFTGVCNVEIQPVLQKLITTNIDIFVGEPATIEVEPNITDITWTSENPAIATVDETGVVTPISTGETRIKLFNLKSGFEAYCRVGVTVKTQNLLITSDLEMTSGDVMRAFYPNAMGVAWELDEPAILYVDEKRGDIEAILITDRVPFRVTNPFTNIDATFSIKINPSQTYFSGVYENWSALLQDVKDNESRTFVRETNYSGYTNRTIVYSPTEAEKAKRIMELTYLVKKTTRKLVGVDIFYRMANAEYAVAGKDLYLTPTFKSIWQFYRERYHYLGYFSSSEGWTNYYFISKDRNVFIEIDFRTFYISDHTDLFITHMGTDSDRYKQMKDYIIQGMPSGVSFHAPVSGELL